MTVHQIQESKVDRPGRNQIQTYYAKCGLVGIKNEYVMSAWRSDVSCNECLNQDLALAG